VAKWAFITSCAGSRLPTQAKSLGRLIQEEQMLKRTTFAKQVNSEFHVQASATQPLTLKLTQVVQHAQTAQSETFSLLFQGPAAHWLPQGMQKLKHAHLGEIELFLVPVGKTEHGFEYEAVFNRLIKAKQ
jgi:hypothetical protein